MNGASETTQPGGISIRPLGSGDEAVVRNLATYAGPGDPQALLADPRTLIELNVLWEFSYEGG